MQYLILFREPDGRKDDHTPEEISAHRLHWQQWMEPLLQQNKLLGGKPLALDGRLLKGRAPQVTNGPHTAGIEIVGGYLLIEAHDIDEATAIMKTCPIFEFDGYAEIRPVM
jgi:hypothetical protein